MSKYISREVVHWKNNFISERDKECTWDWSYICNTICWHRVATAITFSQLTWWIQETPVGTHKGTRWGTESSRTETLRWKWKLPWHCNGLSNVFLPWAHWLHLISLQFVNLLLWLTTNYKYSFCYFFPFFTPLFFSLWDLYQYGPLIFTQQCFFIWKLLGILLDFRTIWPVIISLYAAFSVLFRKNNRIMQDIIPFDMFHLSLESRYEH